MTDGKENQMQDVWRIKWRFTLGARPGHQREGIWSALHPVSADQVARDVAVRMTQHASVPYREPRSYPLTLEATAYRMGEGVIPEEVASALAVIETEGEPFCLMPDGSPVRNIVVDGSVLETENDWTQVRRN